MHCVNWLKRLDATHGFEPSARCPLSWRSAAHISLGCSAYVPGRSSSCMSNGHKEAQAQVELQLSRGEESSRSGQKMGLLNWLGSVPDSVLIFRRMCAMSKARFDKWPKG